MMVPPPASDAVAAAAPAPRPRLNDLFPALLLATTVALQAFAPSTTLALRYDRAQVTAGQLWRLVTGNLVHLNWPHLVLNLAGLVLIWLLLGRDWSLRLWCATFAVCTLAVGGGLYAFDPALRWYVGLSGVLHGLFVAGVLVTPGLSRIERVALLAAVAAKLAWEHLFGPTPGVTALIHGAVVGQAHLYGAAGGLLFGVAVRLRERIASGRRG